MKAFVSIELEIDFPKSDAKIIKEACNKSGQTLSYFLGNVLEKVLTDNADIDPKFIKKLEVENIILE